MVATTTETKAFKMFALDFLRLEREQKEIVINELITYHGKYEKLIKDGSFLGDFESSIMSVSFDMWVTNALSLEELAEVIKEFIATW